MSRCMNLVKQINIVNTLSRCYKLEVKIDLKDIVLPMNDFQYNYYTDQYFRLLQHPFIKYNCINKVHYLNR
jgi:hypothetical protein